MSSSARYVALRTREYLDSPRLDAQTEAALLRRWQDEGDIDARKNLIEANMRHVVAIARKYQRYPVAAEDMLAEGAMGLVIAIDRFDATKNVRLVTYASYWIRAYIFQSVIRDWKRGKTGLGMTRSKTFFRIRRVRAMYRARFGSERDHLPEMARDLDVSVKSLGEMLDYLETHDTSIDSDWSRDDDSRAGLHERVAIDDPDPEDVASMSQNQLKMRKLIGRAMQCLDEREKLVASSRLMEEDPRTLADLGRTMGVSRERARQIEVRAREKLGRALMREGINRSNFHSVVAH